MDFQSSLGTLDLLLGFGKQFNKIKVNAGFQLPLIQNKNTYFSDTNRTEAFYQVPSTNQFYRKADAILRVQYNWTLKKNWYFNPNVLFIYHFGEDSYINEMGMRENLVGSSGTTLNAGLLFGKTLMNHRAIEFNLASPLIVRKIRPDGLTRAIVLSIDYKLGF